MPTSATNIYGMSRLVPMYDSDDAIRQPVNLPASVSYPKGTVLGEVTATPGTFKAYASGNGDGSEVPKAILEYDCATDASGNITVGSTTAGSAPFGATEKAAPAYFGGYFNTADLKASGAGSLDAGGMAAANWHLVSGSLTAGVISLA